MLGHLSIVHMTDLAVEKQKTNKKVPNLHLEPFNRLCSRLIYQEPTIHPPGHFVLL